MRRPFDCTDRLTPLLKLALGVAHGTKAKYSNRRYLDAMRCRAGHDAQTLQTSKMTQSDTPRPRIAALRKVHSITSSARS